MAAMMESKVVKNGDQPQRRRGAEESGPHQVNQRTPRMVERSVSEFPKIITCTSAVSSWLTPFKVVRYQVFERRSSGHHSTTSSSANDRSSSVLPFGSSHRNTTLRNCSTKHRPVVFRREERGLDRKDKRIRVICYDGFAFPKFDATPRFAALQSFEKLGFETNRIPGSVKGGGGVADQYDFAIGVLLRFRVTRKTIVVAAGAKRRYSQQ
jgi:hypothetical protein